MERTSTILSVAAVLSVTFILAQVPQASTLKSVPAVTSPGTEPSCSIPTPGGSKDDAYMAYFERDEYAWKLFLALSRQGDESSPGAPNPKKANLTQYDSDKPVVWETWALASGGRSGPFRRTIPNRSELYLDKGQKPQPWGQWQRDSASNKILEPFQSEDPSNFGPIKASRPQTFHGFAGEQVFTAMEFFSDISVIGPEQIGEEVRTNKCSYEHIVSDELYNLEGLEAKARIGLNPRDPHPELIEFPAGAQEVKAKWKQISEADKPRYHWRTLTLNGETQIYGLTGLHIITRDLPNWFWASFEQVDTEKDAELPSVDSTTRGPNATKRAGTEEGARIETKGSKWEYYRLRGTQVEFSTSRRPTVLANSQIEHGFQQSSSCITCHSRAVVGLRSSRPDLNPCQPNTLPVFLYSTDEPGLDNVGGIRYGPVGAPDPSWFRVDGARPRYIQTSFLWSIPFRALSKYEIPPKAPGGPTGNCQAP
jgi:hypothetical protein